MVKDGLNLTLHANAVRGIACLAVFMTTSAAIARDGELDFAHGLYRQKQYRLAADEYKSVLGKSTTPEIRHQANYFLGESLLKLKLPDQAAEAFEKIVVDDTAERPYFKMALYRAGELAAQRAAHDRASNYLSKFLTQYKSDDLVPRAALLLAQTKLAENKFDEAERAVELGLASPKVKPLSRHFLLMRGRIAEGNKKWDDAIAAYAELAKEPSAPLGDDAVFSLGVACLAAGKAAQAETILTQFVESYPRNKNRSLAIVQLGIAQYQLDKRDEAQKSFSQYLVEAPNGDETAKAQSYLLRIAAAAGDIAKARSAFEGVKQADKQKTWLGESALSLSEAIAKNPAKAGGDAMAELTALAGEITKPESKLRIEYLRAVLLYDRQEVKEAAEVLTRLLDSAKDPAAIADARYLLGACFVKQKEWNKAVDSFRQSADTAEASSATHEAAVRAMAKAILSTDLTNVEERHVSALLSRVVKLSDAAALLEPLAKQLRAKKQLALAKSTYSSWQSIAKTPKERATVLCGIAWCYFDSNELKPAAEAFERVIEIPEASPECTSEALCGIGSLAEKAGDDKAALDAYRRASEGPATSPYAFRGGNEAVRIANKLGNKQEADKILLAMSERFKTAGQSAQILFDRAWIALEQQRKDDAEQLFHKVVSEHPESELAAESALKCAELLHDRGKLTEATAILSGMEHRKLEPSMESALLLRKGLIAFDNAKFEDARKSLEMIVEKYSDSRNAASARFWLAELEYKTGKEDAALKRFEDILKSAGSESAKRTAMLRIAQVHLDHKRWKQAIDQAEAFVHSTKDVAEQGEGLCIQGRALQQQAKFEDARGKYFKVVEGPKTESAAKAQFLIGETYFHQRMYSEGLRAYLKVEMLYDFPAWQSIALLQAGKCHEKLEDKPAAMEIYERLLKRFPASSSFGEAKTRLAALQKTDG